MRSLQGGTYLDNCVVSLSLEGEYPVNANTIYFELKSSEKRINNVHVTSSEFLTKVY
jgi:hypothetical protein